MPLFKIGYICLGCLPVNRVNLHEKYNYPLNRLGFGHAGDVEPVGQGISELRIHFGPG